MEVCVLYLDSVFHKRWLAKQNKVTITLDNYEEDGAVAASGRRKAPPVEEDEEPLKKIPRKDKGNVRPLIYSGEGIPPSPSFLTIQTGR